MNCNWPNVVCVCMILICLFIHRNGRRRRRLLGRARRTSGTAAAPPSGLRPKKAAWVADRVLTLYEHHGLSPRKLADLFNQLYFAETGVSVGRTWVRELLIKEAHRALHRRRELKHCVPARLPRNRLWGIDTTCVTDAKGVQHIVLGAIDHGSRLNLMLRRVRRFNRWTFLGCLLLAIGEFGRPEAIKTDNHPVFRSRLVGRV